MQRLLKASIIFSFGLILPVLAQIPRTISYQGVLTDAKGNPRPDGNYDLTFALYAESTGGTKLWQETKSLAVAKGMFSTSLGDVTAIPLSFDRQYYLGIAVGTGQEFSQRIKLSAAAYAFRAVSADSSGKATLANNAIRATVADSAVKAAVAYRVSGSGAGVQADTIKASMVMAKDTNGVKVVSAGGVGVSIRNNGNVGVGTIIPTDQQMFGRAVDIVGGIGSVIYLRGNASVTKHAFLGYTLADERLQLGAYGDSGKIIFNTGTGSSSEKVRITSTGNVGIGTNAPKYKLHVLDGLGLEGNGQYRKALTSTYWGYSAGYRVLMIGSPSAKYNGQDSAVTLAFNYDPKINPNWAFTGDGREILFRNGSQFVTPNNANDTFYLYNLVLLDGKVGIGTPTPCSKLQVKGTITADATVVVDANCTSDRRFKSVLAPITSALDKIKHLSGVLFTWKRAEFPDRNFPKGPQIGLVAQDVEKVLPELVHTDNEGYKSLSYDKLTAVLVEAVKEQQAMIDSLRTEMASMKVQLGLK